MSCFLRGDLQLRWRFGGVGGGRRAVEGKEMRDASENGKVWLPKFSMLECSAGAAGGWNAAAVASSYEKPAARRMPRALRTTAERPTLKPNGTNFGKERQSDSVCRKNAPPSARFD